ncbi:class I SAM-dependent methyltransferase [Limnoglobus roseus]|uniref:Methyltransferase type 11 n=1 Tax=Limnoglobus roseus TaxID=2598579 RepID=A0A5C1A282_9BACT|nr:methyltransferase domain-containing protein [Limnoglobus roseus]QEL13251.1 methyltransferase type 11 [Limnoglobus roseus]
MLPKEARWFAAQVARLGDVAVFPMLNVGSHTAEFRARTQPWIDRHLFRPFAERGQSVVHTDIQDAPGVDLVGDLTDADFLDRVRARKFRSVFCNNLLEHVPDPDRICRALTAAVEPGGYLLVSVPHRFPYHPDPIDTMFRPSPEELAKLFPNTTVVAAEKIRCGNLTTYLAGRFFQSPAAMLRTAGERARGQTGADRAAGTGKPGRPIRFLPWLVRPFVQTCLVLRVPA